MTIQEEIKGLKSAFARDQIVDLYAHNNFDELMRFFFSDDQRLVEKVSWVLQQTTDDYPECLLPYCSRLITQLPHYKTDAEKRFVMRYFNTQPLPKNEDELSQLLNIGFDWLLNPKESIATRANTMTVLYRISLMIPEIQQELASVIESTMEFGSTGYNNRAGYLLKKLAKVKN